MEYPSFKRELASVLLRSVVVVVAIIFLFSFAYTWVEDDSLSDGTCNIAVLPIEGVILPFANYADFPLITTPRGVRTFLERAENDRYIKGVVFEINSPGGTPVAAAEIASMIRETTLPTVAIIGDLGTSGGYLVAAGADYVLASPMSDIGSIGVTMSYLEYSKQNEEEGINFVELASARFKDIGNPNRALRDEEREILLADLAIIHDEFVAEVSNYRNLELSKVDELADGLTMPGRRALEAGLIDELGGRAMAKRVLSDKLSLEEAAVRFCSL